jgi:O-antigen ligase
MIPVSRAGIVLFSALIVIVWLFQPTIKDDIKYLSKNRFTVVFIIFVLYTFIALLWSSNIDEGINYAKRYWYYLPMFIIATNLKKEYINSVISAFLLSMLLSEILSYGMYFEILDIKNRVTPYPTPFMHHIQYSVFVVFTSLFLLNKIYYLDELKNKMMYGVFFITVTMNIFINGGRTGYITFFIALGIVAFLNIKNKMKASLVAIVIMIGTLFVAYNYSSTFQQRMDDSVVEIKEINNNNLLTSVGQRIAMYQIGSEIIADNFLFGVGTGEEMDALKVDIDKNHSEFSAIKQRRHFHNVFLHTAVQLGILGLILQILIFYYLLKLDIKDKYYLNMKYMFATVYILSCFSGNMFHQQFTMALFALIVGILLSASKDEVVS